MDYKSTIEYLYGRLPMFSRVGAAAYKPGLETVERLDDAFNHPHRKFKSIHIAGTNGKGSTSSMLASVLQEEGYKVGLYTSPHLVDFRERIRINGEMIPEQDVIDFVKQFQEMNYDGHPSFFELTMMMAFDWFAKQSVDYAVIEVGMGGRLDSTNIITPEISVITNISFDHTQFLGDTLPKIASEKAGIIKNNIPVVIGERGSKDVADTFLNKASETNAPIRFAEDNKVPITRSDSDNWEIDYHNQKIEIPLGGEYQKHNILTVITAIEEMQKAGITLSEKSLKNGLQNVITNTGFAGRWMHISDNPLTICDTGHNVDGLASNMAQIENWKKKNPKGRLHFVIGFVADKDVAHILPMFPCDATYYLTKAAIPRAMSLEQLASLAKDANLKGDAYPTVKEAVKEARLAAAPEDFIYIGGSTFIVADFLASE